MKFKDFCNNVLSAAKRNDTKILTGIAIVGAITAPILASRATLKAKKKIDDYTEVGARISEKIGKEPTAPSLATKARLTAHYYIPAVAVVGISIYSMIKCEKIHVSRELEILGLSAFWENRYRLLNDKITTEYGPEMATALKKDIAAEQRDLAEYFSETGETSIKNEEGKEKKILVDHNTKFLLYDPICGDYNYATLNDLAAATCVLNKRFIGMGYYGTVTWNEIRRVIGWPSNPIAKKYGWNGDTDEDLIEMMQYNGDSWIDVYVGTSEGVDPLMEKDGSLTLARALYFNYSPSLL